MQLTSLTYLTSVILIVVSSNIAPILSSFNVPRSPLVHVRIGVIGDKVVLNCSVNENDSASWTYTSLTKSTETHLYLGTDIVVSLRSRYRIDKTIRGQHNLIIDSVDLAHAGRYQCIGVQLSLINDIELIVLGSHPVCAANVSAAQYEDKKQRYIQVSVWCSINYTGNGFPVFNWTKGNAEKSIVANTTTSSTSLGPVINTSSILEHLQANDSGVTLNCRIAFQMPNNTHGLNVFTWDYKPYGPKNLSIIEYEDRLECSADGNPAPTYKWIVPEGNISTEGSVFALNDTVTFAEDHTFQCTAANLFVAENINITIKAKDSGLTQGDFDFPFPITALAIGLALLSLLTIAIIIACIFNRKRLKGDTSHRPDVALNTHHTDLNSYEEIVLNCDRSPNYNLDGDQLPGTSDERTISDNAVYSEVLRSRGRLNGSNAGNIGEYSRPHQTQTRERKTLIGADGTEYVELSGVSPSVRKHDEGLPKPPAFSRVEVYASIDHNGRAPPPPPTL